MGDISWWGQSEIISCEFGTAKVPVSISSFVFQTFVVIEFLLHNSYPVVCSWVLCQTGTLVFSHSFIVLWRTQRTFSAKKKVCVRVCGCVCVPICVWLCMFQCEAAWVTFVRIVEEWGEGSPFVWWKSVLLERFIAEWWGPMLLMSFPHGHPVCGVLQESSAIAANGQRFF